METTGSKSEFVAGPAAVSEFEHLSRRKLLTYISDLENDFNFLSEKAIREISGLEDQIKELRSHAKN